MRHRPLDQRRTSGRRDILQTLARASEISPVDRSQAICLLKTGLSYSWGRRPILRPDGSRRSWSQPSIIALIPNLWLHPNGVGESPPLCQRSVSPLCVDQTSPRVLNSCRRICSAAVVPWVRTTTPEISSCSFGPPSSRAGQSMYRSSFSPVRNGQSTVKFIPELLRLMIRPEPVAAGARHPERA